MNPLDLPGPAFLKFYLVFGAIVIAIAYWIRGRLQNADPPHRAVPRFSAGHYPKESEAYHIAYLRGGVDEFTRTARVASATQSEVAKTAQPESAPRISDIIHELETEGMIFRGASQRPFFQLTSITVLVLIGMAVAKILVALSRGRSNIEILVVLAIVYGLAAILLLRPPRVTKAARDYLAWVDRAHDGLLSLVNQGRRVSPGEIALCAAIYGLGPITTAPVTNLKAKLRSESAKTAATSSCSVAVSSCSSSSCGGGCGGGGCGGCGS